VPAICTRAFNHLAHHRLFGRGARRDPGEPVPVRDQVGDRRRHRRRLRLHACRLHRIRMVTKRATASMLRLPLTAPDSSSCRSKRSDRGAFNLPARVGQRFGVSL
jgi:hypothetical protein